MNLWSRSTWSQCLAIRYSPNLFFSFFSFSQRDCISSTSEEIDSDRILSTRFVKGGKKGIVNSSINGIPQHYCHHQSGCLHLVVMVQSAWSHNCIQGCNDKQITSNCTTDWEHVLLLAAYTTSSSFYNPDTFIKRPIDPRKLIWVWKPPRWMAVILACSLP